MRRTILRWQTAGTLLLAVASGGCFLVAAGAGAGAAVAYTNRGVKSVVNASVEQLLDRSASVFQQMGITQTGRSTEDSGAKGRLIGNKGDLEITVELSSTSPNSANTNVEVYARKNPIDYDKDTAKQVLNRIIERP
jgi:uncharacterized protein DUF3568